MGKKQQVFGELDSEVLTIQLLQESEQEVLPQCHSYMLHVKSVDARKPMGKSLDCKCRIKPLRHARKKWLECPDRLLMCCIVV